MKWFLNLLGIVLYFMIRYKNREDKTQKFSGVFWFNDNWVETIGTLIVNVILSFLLHWGGITIDLSKWITWLPEGIAVVGDLAVYCAIGAVISHAVYELVAKGKGK